MSNERFRLYDVCIYTASEKLQYVHAKPYYINHGDVVLFAGYSMLPEFALVYASESNYLNNIFHVIHKDKLCVIGSTL